MDSGGRADEFDDVVAWIAPAALPVEVERKARQSRRGIPRS
jgi:hypothetical protein